MRFRSGLEAAALVLGAAVDGVWAGALGAALTGQGPALILLAFLTVLAGALVARWYGRAEERPYAGRMGVALVVLIAVGVMLAAGRVWAHPSPLWPVLRDVVYAAGLAYLGARLGRGPQAPEDALRRALRGFAFLCVIVAGVSAAAPAPSWVAQAVLASLGLGGLYVAMVRYQSLTELVDPSSRLPARPWLMAVAGALLLVIVGGALLSLTFSAYVLPSLLGVAVTVLDAVVRGVTWLLGLIQVHGLPTFEPKALPAPIASPHPHTVVVKDLGATRAILTAVAVLAAAVVSLALVMAALRRTRRETPPEVEEERESLATLTSAAGDLAARMGRRLRRLDPRRLTVRTPAEKVRQRYAELEQRLSRAGRPRSTGVTVRAYLEALADASPRTGAAAGDLAAIYELARYSGHALQAADARRFEVLAKELLAT